MGLYDRAERAMLHHLDRVVVALAMPGHTLALTVASLDAFQAALSAP
jgi:hypothetical protein